MPRISKETAQMRIQLILDQIPELRNIERGAPEFTKWHRDTRVALENIFADQPERVTDFTRSSYFLSGVSTETTESELHRAYVRGLEEIAAILQSMIEEIQAYWGEDDTPDSLPTRSADPLTFTNEVFVVHGHDHGTKETVARFLLSLDLKPIILHEQPNQGRTIIEKFENYSQTSYAIALLTQDDVGGPTAEDLRPQARQNVILELGFFLGSLGRGKVAALKKGDLELPSDYLGVLYIDLDENDGWKMKLARELNAAGFEIDLKRLL